MWKDGKVNMLNKQNIETWYAKIHIILEMVYLEQDWWLPLGLVVELEGDLTTLLVMAKLQALLYLELVLRLVPEKEVKNIKL